MYWNSQPAGEPHLITSSHGWRPLPCCSVIWERESAGWIKNDLANKIGHSNAVQRHGDIKNREGAGQVSCSIDVDDGRSSPLLKSFPYYGKDRARSNIWQQPISGSIGTDQS
jgi:hypothetical protein